MTSRRQDILRASARHFAVHGFHGVAIDQIGADLGISGPALYHHFRSKEAILAELLVGISETLLAEGAERVAAAASPAAALDALVGWHVEFAMEHPDLITVQERDLASLGDAEQRTVRALQRRYVGLWADAIVGATGTEPAVATAAAHAAFGLLNSTPHSARLPARRMRALLRSMCLGAIGAVAATGSPG